MASEQIANSLSKYNEAGEFVIIPFTLFFVRAS